MSKPTLERALVRTATAPRSGPATRRCVNVARRLAGPVGGARAARVLIVPALLLASAALACGPWILNRMLDGDTDARLLRSPVADFTRELLRVMPRPESALTARPPEERDFDGDAYRAQTADADLAELEAVLRDPRMTDVDVPSLLHQYRMLRGHLRTHANEAKRARDLKLPPQPLGDVHLPRGLPWEFEQYLRGAVAYHDNRRDQAIEEWKRLLARPAAARRHRSTWAAFMIGKTLLDGDPAAALEWFERTRSLERDGFDDALGLAASSLGWQARALLALQRPTEALTLYLEQWRTGEPTAYVSIMLACRAVLDGDDAAVDAAARDATLRAVVTAYILSGGGGDIPANAFGRPERPAATRWLAAVERAVLPPPLGDGAASSRRERVPSSDAAFVDTPPGDQPGHPLPSPPSGGEGAGRAVPNADRLAWLAYQWSDHAAAARWAALAGDEPLALWVRAKLTLRDGRVDAAAALLADAVRRLPVEETWPDVSYEHWAVDTGFGRGGDSYGAFSPRAMAEGELAVLHLLRGRYDESLDLLLAAGYGEDAAYIAERLLTLDELQRYLEQRGDAARDLRPTLGRALARDGRFAEARPYFLEFSLERFDAYAAAVRTARDDTRHKLIRAAAWWEAARLASRGDDFLGFAAEPTFHVEGRDSLHARTAEARVGLPADALSAPCDDERRRLAASAPLIVRDRHYPFIAAEHAWQAALLMPDGDAATARILCLGGSWIKYRDPKAADRFYKALVTRCGATDLGRRAVQRKWFPIIDDDPDYAVK